MAAVLELGACDRVCGTQTLKYVLSGTLSSLSTPVLIQWTNFFMSHSFLNVILGNHAGENPFIFICLRP